MTEQNSTIRKIAVFVIAAAFLLVISYFSLYEGTHAVHVCTGESCPICHELHLAEAFTNQAVLVVAFLTAGFLLAVFAWKAEAVITSSVPERNLVMDKVRLDD